MMQPYLKIMLIPHECPVKAVAFMLQTDQSQILSKVTEQVTLWLDDFKLYLDEKDVLEPLQSDLRLGYGTKTALIILVDGLHQEMNRGSIIVTSRGSLISF